MVTWSDLQIAGTRGRVLKWRLLFSTERGAHWGPELVQELFVYSAFGSCLC